MLLAMNCKLAWVGVPPPGVRLCSAVLAATAAFSRTLSASPASAGGSGARTSLEVVGTQSWLGNRASPTRATGGPASGTLGTRNSPITCWRTVIFVPLPGSPGTTRSDIEPDLSTSSMRLGLGWSKASGTLVSCWATVPGMTGSKS